MQRRVLVLPDGELEVVIAELRCLLRHATNDRCSRTAVAQECGHLLLHRRLEQRRNDVVLQEIGDDHFLGRAMFLRNRARGRECVVQVLGSGEVHPQPLAGPEGLRVLPALDRRQAVQGRAEFQLELVVERDGAEHQVLVVAHGGGVELEIPVIAIELDRAVRERLRPVEVPHVGEATVLRPLVGEPLRFQEAVAVVPDLLLASIEHCPRRGFELTDLHIGGAVADALDAAGVVNGRIEVAGRQVLQGGGRMFFGRKRRRARSQACAFGAVEEHADARVPAGRTLALVQIDPALLAGTHAVAIAVRRGRFEVEIGVGSLCEAEQIGVLVRAPFPILRAERCPERYVVRQSPHDAAGLRTATACRRCLR